MSILGSLKAVFVEDVPTPAPAQPTTAAVPAVSKVYGSGASAPVSSPPAASATSEKVEEARASLKKNLAGTFPEDAKLLAQLDTMTAALSDAIPDADGRIRAAVKALTATGVTGQAALNQSIGNMIGGLSAQQDNFRKAIESSLTNDVGKREERLRDIEREILSLDNEQKKLNNELTDIKTRLELAGAAFADALDSVKQELELRRSNLQLAATR